MSKPGLITFIFGWPFAVVGFLCGLIVDTFMRGWRLYSVVISDE
jgi:hypothetical protein